MNSKKKYKYCCKLVELQSLSQNKHLYSDKTLLKRLRSMNYKDKRLKTDDVAKNLFRGPKYY